MGNKDFAGFLCCEVDRSLSLSTIALNSISPRTHVNVVGQKRSICLGSNGKIKGDGY